MATTHPLFDLPFVINHLFLDDEKKTYSVHYFSDWLQESMRKGPLSSHLVGHMWLKAFGWKWVGEVPEFPRYVLIAAPHTSNWDLPFMLAISYIMQIKLHWAGKKELFKPPMGGLLKMLGGVSIDRSARHNYVAALADTMHSKDRFIFVVAPEGTRSKTDRWKTGFYHIALKADVPIVCGFLDYERKEGGIGPVVHPTGDMEKDLEPILEFYKDKQGLFPEKMMDQITIKKPDNGNKPA